MKTRMKLWTLAATGLLALTACGDEHETNEAANLQVEFKMYVDIMTRAYTPESGFATSFADNDEVGIFACDETDGAVYTNVRYTQVGVNQWSGEPIMASSNTAYSYYAYHPYDETVNDPTNVPVSVDADQTQGYDSSDVLLVKQERVSAGTTHVNLGYHHAFSMVQIKLTGTNASKDAVVTLHNVQTSAVLNLKTSSVNLLGQTGHVLMRSCQIGDKTDEYYFRAIVPAQSIKKGDKILSVSNNGMNFDFTYSSDVPYEQGNLRQVNIILGETPEDSNISIEYADGDIGAWGESEPIEGEGSITE